MGWASESAWVSEGTRAAVTEAHTYRDIDPVIRLIFLYFTVYSLSLNKKKKGWWGGELRGEACSQPSRAGTGLVGTGLAGTGLDSTGKRGSGKQAELEPRNYLRNPLLPEAARELRCLSSESDVEGSWAGRECPSTSR